MILTYQQKKYIKTYRNTRTVDEIAYVLELSPDIVRGFIKKETSVNFINLIRSNWQTLCLLSFLVIVVYANSVFGHFVSDDIPIIFDSKTIGTFSGLFAKPYVMLRDFFNFTIYSFFGRNPTPFHFLNIIFHIGSVCVIFLIIKTLNNKRTALFASVLFAVHPIITESVSWISGGVYPQYSFFILVSFLLFILSNDSPQSYRNSIYSVVFFLLALLSSEKAIVYPLILFVFLISFSQFLKRWKSLIIYFALSFIWISIYYFQYRERVVVHQYSFGNTEYISNPFLLAATSIVNYVQLIVWPIHLTIFHSEFILNRFNIVLIICQFVVLVGICLIGFFKNRPIFFWLSLFILSLGITLLPLQLSWIVAERYAYLGSVGIFTTVAIFLDHLVERKKYAKVIYSVFIVVVFLLMIRTIVRNRDWQTKERLWTATVKSTPTNPVAHSSLGNIYREKNDLPRAEAEFQKSVMLNPNYAEGYYNLADVYRLENKFDQAVTNYQKSVELNPHLWQSYQAIGAVFYLQKDYSLAIANTQKAISMEKNNAELYINIGIMYYESGKKDSAQEAFERALTIEPTNTKAQMGLERVINSR